MVDFATMQCVQEKLTDEVSKNIFDVRLNYAVTGDWHYFLPINEGRKFHLPFLTDFLQEQNKPVVVFGAGLDGRHTVRLLRQSGIEVVAVCDSKAQMLPEGGHAQIEEVPLWTFSELCARKNGVCVVVGSSKYWQSICQQLLVAGFSYGSVYCPMAHRLHVVGYLPNQYFDFFLPRSREIFVDAGSYNGKTTVLFSEWAAGGMEKAYLFEANPDNERTIRENLTAAGINNYNLVMKGTWDREEQVRFDSKSSAGSMVSESGDILVDMTSIDQALAGAETTFIKMDIEGSEAKALIGAENTLRRYKPRLAISLYHKPWDFIELPGLLLELAPDYKLAIRHYSSYENETVLYAWCE